MLTKVDDITNFYLNGCMTESSEIRMKVLSFICNTDMEMKRQAKMRKKVLSRIRYKTKQASKLDRQMQKLIITEDD